MYVYLKNKDPGPKISRSACRIWNVRQDVLESTYLDKIGVSCPDLSPRPSGSLDLEQAGVIRKVSKGRTSCSKFPQDMLGQGRSSYPLFSIAQDNGLEKFKYITSCPNQGGLLGSSYGLGIKLHVVVTTGRTWNPQLSNGNTDLWTIQNENEPIFCLKSLLGTCTTSYVG